uniref:SWIM-type domain-containing protein n=1 Tax=Arundo donax TaxID=35708 RepID=A0A0A8XV12_ARUDO
MQTPYAKRMMEHLEKKNVKAVQHTVRAMGVNEHRFEITLRGKGCVGSDIRIVTHEVNLGHVFNVWCECSCNKPKLLHIPCSHVLAALSQVGVATSFYMSPVFMRENVVLT